MRALLAAAFLALAVLPARADTGPQALQGFVDRALDFYLRPAAADFSGRAEALAGDLGALCEAPGDDALETARDAFRETAGAWAELSFLTLDPMREDDRQARIYFWPDPRGITLRQVQGLLAEEDPTAAGAGTLKDKSVALQGLGALEFVLFGTGSDALADGPAGFRCRYAQAIGDNLASIGAALVEALAPGSTFSQRLAGPGPDNPLYRTPAEAAEDLVGGVAAGIELIRDRVVRPAMGDGPQDANGKIGPFWRSGETRDYLARMLTGMERLIETGGVEPIVPDGLAWLSGSIGFEFENAAGALGRVRHPFVDAVRDEQDREALTVFLFSLRNQRDLVSEALMSAAGLKAGFNALDGD